MVQDRRIVEWEFVCTLFNGDIASDLEWFLTPQTTPISMFCIAFHIFVVGEYRDFKFGVRVHHSK